MLRQRSCGSLVLLCLACASCGENPTSASDSQPAAQTAFFAGEELITVTPDTDIIDGQFVDVVVNTLAYAVALCPTDATMLFYCASGEMTVSQPDGTYTARLAVNRSFMSQGRFVDCAQPGACMIGFDLGGGLVGAPIQFRSAGPWPTGGSISATPASNWVDLQQITVSGTGFSQDFQIHVAQCRPSAGSPYSNCGNWKGPIALNANGSFTTAFEVKRTYFVNPEEHGESFTCDSPGACVLYAGPLIPPTGSGVWGATAPATFAPVGAPRRGTVRVSSGTITAGSTFTASGSGWADSSTLFARVCAGSSVEPEWCRPPNLVRLQLAPGETT
ncbi:MAG TPA: neocarzinostatin apoprotein domain-containing protein, partial [Polyangiaceae bacterium]|nr:neocarzinostatin apoprotein domain-containing protein [Polyangiaceae bacterium]